MKIIKKIELDTNEKTALQKCHDIWFDFRAHCNNDCELCIFNGFCNNMGDIMRLASPVDYFIDNMSERI